MIVRGVESVFMWYSVLVRRIGDGDRFILRDIGGIVSISLLYVETKGVSRSLWGCGGGLGGIVVGVEM